MFFFSLSWSQPGLRSVLGRRSPAPARAPRCRAAVGRNIERGRTSRAPRSLLQRLLRAPLRQRARTRISNVGRSSPIPLSSVFAQAAQLRLPRCQGLRGHRLLVQGRRSAARNASCPLRSAPYDVRSRPGQEKEGTAQRRLTAARDL